MLPTSDENNPGSVSAAGTMASRGADFAARQNALVRGGPGSAVTARPAQARPIAPRPEILYSTPTAIDLIRALQRRWLLALIVGIVFATCAIVYVALTTGPPNAAATAFVRIRAAKPMLLYPTSEAAFAGKYGTYAAIQQDLIKRKLVLDPVMKQPGVLELPDFEGLTDPREIFNRLRGMFTAKINMSTERLYITVSSKYPETCKFLANTIKHVYLSEVVETEKQLRLQEFEELEARYDTYRQKFLQQKAKLTEMERSYGGDVSGPAVIAEKERAAQRLASIRNKASELSLRVNNLEMHIQLAKRRLEDGKVDPANEPKADKTDARPLPGQILESVISKDPLLASWKSKLADLEQLISSEREKARDPRAVSIQDLLTRAKELQTQIQERTAELQLQVWANLDPDAPAEELSPLEKLEQDRELVNNDLNFYIKQYEQQVGEARRIKEYSDDLEVRRVNVDFIGKSVETMRGELQRREFEMQAQPRVEDSEDADLPLPPSNDAKYKKMRVAGFGGFCLALIGVALYEFMARRITSPVEMTEGLGVRVMGNIPLLSERSWKHRFGMREESQRTLDYLAGESMDSIRETMLRGEAEGLAVVMVASAVRGEGKSTVAAQLAESVARSGRRTVLVDGDLRSPSAHVLLDMPIGLGLSELLSGAAVLKDVVRTTQSEGLWLISAGSATSEGLRELARGGMQTVVETLREEFDFVVIDTPPTLEVPDALAIGNYVDAAIVSVVYRVSQISRVYETIERLQAAGIDVQGCVVNGRSSGRIGKYDYGYDYGYSYGYGKYGNGANGHSDSSET